MRTLDHAKTGIVLLLGALTALAACGEKADPAADAAKKKKELEDALAIVGPAVGKISAFEAHIARPEDKDPYAPKVHQSDDRAATAAANEIRHEATATRQALKKLGSSATAGIETAFDGVSASCADVKETEKMPACVASIKALDAALEKANGEASASGVKFPRVGKEAITKEAEATTRQLVSARGPGADELAYRKLRGEAATKLEDLEAACQKADQEAEAAAQQHEKSDEPIRLVAVTRKMSMASQCKKLKTAAAARTEMEVCKKTPKSTECSVGCGKVKAVIDEGIPAALFGTMQKEYDEACKAVK